MKEKRPEPVRWAAIARLAAIAIAGVAAFFGIDLNAGELQPVLVGLAAGIVPAVEFISSKLTRDQVTPSADPRDNDGHPLVRAETSSG